MNVKLVEVEVVLASWKLSMAHYQKSQTDHEQQDGLVR